MSLFSNKLLNKKQQKEVFRSEIEERFEEEKLWGNPMYQGAVSSFTTSPYAEIVCLEKIEPSYITKIIFSNGDIKGKVMNKFQRNNLVWSGEVEPEILKKRVDTLENEKRNWENLWG